ncbi:MAG: TnpV protein [Clostridia bacterium]|nr:TnpV protein [Clostridia bacterium]
MSEKIKISYRQVGDYKIPNIILPPEQANIIIGKWGMLHKNYLEHNKRGIFMLMVTKCTLWPYLADIDRQANEMYDLLIEQIKEAEGVTEELKEQDQLEWVQRMDNIQQRAREIVCNELIYS